MARWQPRREQRTQIDPFNAPDPVMPGDDVVVMEPDATAGHARRKTAETKARPASSHAPNPGAGPSHAPTPKRPLARQRRRKADADDPTSPWARRASRTALRMVAILFAVIVIVNIVSIFGTVASSLSDAWSSEEDGYDFSYDAYDDDYDYEAAARAELAMETEASARVEAELQAYVSSEDAAVARAGEEVSRAIEDWTGVDPAALGIDATELARWALENSSYEMSDTYAFAEPDADGYSVEGDVYFYVTAPDLGTVVNGISSLCYNELYDARGRGSLTPDEQALVEGRLEALRSEALTESSERFLYAVYEGSVDEDGNVLDLSFTSDVLNGLPL